MAASRRDGLASFLGIVVFLVGVGVIVAMFGQALAMFSVAPRQNLGMQTGKPIDLTVVGNNLGRTVIQILLLIVMTGIGSALANRGVKMYASGRPVEGEPVKKVQEDLASRPQE